MADLLKARKNLRDFEVWKGTAGVHKSSLDGCRESVLRDSTTPKNIRGVRIKGGEALDVIGCVKRAAGGNRKFPSVTRVALDPWVRGLAEKGIETTELMSCCENLVTLNVLSRVEGSAFPYEGTALLPQRYAEFEAGLENPEAVKPVTEKMQRIMAKLYEQHKPMDPYLAVLCADGDNMGKTISSLEASGEHKNFSAALSAFANSARNSVKTHHGVCVYAGGDDVLALLPLDKALPCARDLHSLFDELWTEWNFKTPPTLSVGIAIGHALEDMEFLLNLGRKAEKLAKDVPASKKKDKENENGKNGLAITIRARGNAEFFVREQWKNPAKNTENAEILLSKHSLSELSLDERLEFWALCFAEGRIPSKFPYELRASAKFYDEWERGETLDQAMRLDVLRIFRRKDLKLGGDRERVEKYIEETIGGAYDSIERLAGELVAAQWIGTACAAAGGERREKR